MDVERDEVVRRLGEEGFVVLDVRSEGEYRGETTAPCDPRAGRIAGRAALRPAGAARADAGRDPASGSGPPEDVELVAYCHSGSRSELAAQILASLGYRASNYRGSWHEWSRDDALPSETG